MRDDMFRPLEEIEEWREFMFKGCVEPVIIYMVTHHCADEDWIYLRHEDGIFQYSIPSLMWSKVKYRR